MAGQGFRAIEYISFALCNYYTAGAYLVLFSTNFLDRSSDKLFTIPLFYPYKSTSCLSIHSFTVTSFDLPFLPPLYCQMIQRKDLSGFLLDALQDKIAGKLIYEIELSNRQNTYEANEGGKEETLLLQV